MYSNFTKSVFGIFREGGNTVFQQGAGQTGLFIIRQPGGVAGTDQGELSSDGTDFIIENKAGGVNRLKNTSSGRTTFSGVSGASLYFENDNIVLSMFAPNGTGLVSFAPAFNANADLGFIATRFYASSGTTSSDLSFSRDAAGEWAVGDALAGKALLLGASGLVRGKAVAAVATTNRARTTNVSTLTTATHNLVASQVVTITGMTDTTFNGTFVVSTVPSATTFTYANTGSDVGSGADVGGTVTPQAVLQLGTAPTTPVSASTAAVQSAASFTATTYFGIAAGSVATPTLAAIPVTGTDAVPLAVVLGGGLGTGAGAGGSFTIATPTTLSTGTTAQTRVARLTISQGAVTTDLATVTVADLVNFVFNTGTGSKLGSAVGQKIGIWNAAPIVQPGSAGSALTAISQTYSTVVNDNATATSADIGAFTGGLVGFLDAGERDNIRTQYNALRADVISLKGLCNRLIDAMQLRGVEA